MKFFITVAALIAACSAAAIPQQQPLPAKFSLTFNLDSPTPRDVIVDQSFVSRILLGDPGSIYYGDPKLAVFHLDGDGNIMLDDYSFGADVSGYILLYREDTPRDWKFPIQLGTFAQADGLLAFNAGDGHGPPTTQWVACPDSSNDLYDLAWNRDDCASVEIKVIPL